MPMDQIGPSLRLMHLEDSVLDPDAPWFNSEALAKQARERNHVGVYESGNGRLASRRT